MKFSNRQKAGELLAQKLLPLRDNACVLAVARGGVLVGTVISKKLNIPLCVIAIKKIGAPYNEELAIGAVGPGNTVYKDSAIVKRLGVSYEQFRKLSLNAQKEQQEKQEMFGNSLQTLRGKAVFVVDDGVATGATLECVLLSLKKNKPSYIFLATPIISQDVYRKLTKKFAIIISLLIVEDFEAVGQFYEHFDQVSDTQVLDLLREKTL